MKTWRDNWRKINSKFHWCSDVGSTTKMPDGWHISASGYEGIILKPSLGPFKTAKLAIEAWRKLKLY